jgi:hypothetical protein
MATIVDDIRSSVRLVRRSPGTVALAVLSLTLGIGANTAVFSFVNAIQFRALPVADEATLVDLSETSTTELCAGCSPRPWRSWPAGCPRGARRRSIRSWRCASREGQSATRCRPLCR